MFTSHVLERVAAGSSWLAGWINGSFDGGWVCSWAFLFFFFSSSVNLISELQIVFCPTEATLLIFG